METELQSNNISVASVAPPPDDKVADGVEETCSLESKTFEEKPDQATDNNVHNPQEEDDLEEGELKDDDDDDDDDDELDIDSAKVGETKSNKTSTKSDSDDESPTKPPSSASSSSSSSESSRPPSVTEDADKQPKPPPSSKGSSRNGSQYGSYSKTSSSYGHESRIKSRHSLVDKYRRGREREDPSEKAAKLISMRTKLLEARSREIEMKFQKNKIRLSPPPSSRLTLEAPKNEKMTLTLPSISYNENPNPPPIVAAIDGVAEPAKKTKSKRDHKEHSKSKKPKKKKKKSKKHKKAKSSSSSKKVSSDAKATASLKSEPVPFDNSDHVGPKTPPDNQVLTMNDEQVEWPSHLIKMTTALPSISYSVNPDSVNTNMNDDERAAALLKRRRSTLSSLTDHKRFKADEKSASFSSSPSRKTVSPHPHKIDDGSSYRKYQSTKTYDLDLNHDYSWYYNYFMNSFEMNANQAQHQALSAVVSGSYNPEVLEKWLNNKGLSKRSSKDPDIKKQLYPFVAKDPLSFIPDASGNSDVALEGSVRTIVTRISRNKVIKDADNQEDEQEEQVNKKDDSIVKQETNTDQQALPEPIKTDPETENLPKKEDEEKACETVDVKDEKSDQEPCTVTVKDIDRCITLRPVHPQITIIKSQKEVILPNGQTLPAGTIQRIVHPYPRVDTEMLGPCFDLY